MKSMNISRFARLFKILARLSPHSQETVKTLAKEFEVSERTIMRDIEVLRDAQLGVIEDEDKTIKITRAGMKRIASWLRS